MANLKVLNEPDVREFFDLVKSGNTSKVQHYAKLYGSEIFKIVENTGCTPFHWACFCGSVELVRCFVDLLLVSVPNGSLNEPSKNFDGQRPIHWAVYKGHFDVVHLLLKSGVPIDTTDKLGRSSLMIASQNGNNVMAAYLVSQGASINVVDNDGHNSLHWACYLGHDKTARLLIIFGLDPNQPDLDRRTPLHHACLNGGLNILRELCVVDGVSVHGEDINGNTALSLARRLRNFRCSSFISKIMHNNNKDNNNNNNNYYDNNYDCDCQRKKQPTFVKKLKVFLVWLFIQFNKPLLTTGYIAIFAYPLYYFLCFQQTLDEITQVHVYFLILNIIFWISLSKTNRCDPGYIDMDLENHSAYQSVIQKVKSYRENVEKFDSSHLVMLDDIKQTILTFTQLCHVCKLVRHTRSKHCFKCGRCVSAFDHHCYYVNNCIGLKNRVWFFILNITITLMACVTLYFCSYLTLTERSNAIIIFASFAASGFLMLSFVILMCTVVYFKTGLTLHEWMKIQENHKATLKSFLHLIFKKDSNPSFSTNYLDNMWHYFCYRSNKIVKLDVVLKEI